MIREERFVLSHGQFAVNMGTFATVPAPDGRTATLSVRAAWYRRKDGVLRACYGRLWDVVGPQDLPWPQDPAAWLRGFTDGRYGGDCHGRWDGERYWGSQEPAVMERHLRLLRPMIDSYPLAPEGYDAWWRFPTSAEQARTRVGS